MPRPSRKARPVRVRAATSPLSAPARTARSVYTVGCASPAHCFDVSNIGHKKRKRINPPGQSPELTAQSPKPAAQLSGINGMRGRTSPSRKQRFRARLRSPQESLSRHRTSASGTIRSGLRHPADARVCAGQHTHKDQLRRHFDRNEQSAARAPTSRRRTEHRSPQKISRCQPTGNRHPTMKRLQTAA